MTPWPPPQSDSPPSLAAQGPRLVKEGATLESAEDNLAELTAQAHVFADKPLVILQALQIA